MTSALTEDARLSDTAAGFRASEQIFRTMRAPLYEAFCRKVVNDPEMLALAGDGMGAAAATHLFSAVHYLLLRDPSDPLARYFATIDDDPLPAGEAYLELVRFCRAHRDEIRDLLETRTVQTTYAERCRALLAPMCVVAREAGEPLNLIEIGCSGGVLLAFDKFAYRLNDQGVIGAPDAPLLLEGELRGGPELFIPRIGTRIGIDLHTIDARSEDERRWLLALCFPELRDEQRRLAKALDVVAQTDIRMMEGDALVHLPAALADTPDPVCVFHSACLFYWPAEARARLDAMLREASRTRPIWRIAIEPAYVFEDWENQPGGAASPSHDLKTGGINLIHYRDGQATREVLGWPNSDYGVIDWRS
ncbi:DUF2332 domain-containing protein [Novosphingobium sp. JCM 18896]|uniref:DUF2332 domain-containing protein n=1 Tax=Novosphingobium sp. JCM 18896 TaxID=2989731 RepID=UPI002223D840|nr:DUF2332 domain-containing protein [Novosphingobium sp. JCM 18896]MCW1427535.1 DUF2332 domain-containing protein [Novosphingobium sp. JCM 18896]